MSLLNLSTSQLEQVLYFAKYIVTDPEGALKDGKPLRRGDLLTDDEYRMLRYGHQETYSVPMGEAAVVADGDYVEAGQNLAKGVKSKMAGLAQYRFPRKVIFDYQEAREATLTLPSKSWIEEEGYKSGQPLADLTDDVVVRAKAEGVVELLPIGADGGLLNLRDMDEDEVTASYFIPNGMELLTGDGEFVEAGADLAKAPKGAQLTTPQRSDAQSRQKTASAGLN